MTITTAIRNYANRHIGEIISTNDLFDYVRAELGKPKLHDGSVMRKLLLLREREFSIKCLDRQKVFYFVGVPVETESNG